MAALVGGFIAVRMHRNGSAFYTGGTIALAASVLLLRVCGVRFHGVTWIERARPTLVAAIPFVVIGILSWLVSYGNTYLLKSFFPANTVALFTFAWTLSSVMHLVANSLNQVWVPRFLKLMHELPGEQLERKNRTFALLQGVALGVTGGLVLAAVPLAINWIGGNLLAYRGMSLELFLLFGAYAISIPWWQSQNYFLGYGRGKDLLRITVWTSLLGMILWLAAILALGLIGCYVGFFLYMGTRTVWAAVRARREWSMRASWEGIAAALLPLAAGASASTLLSRVRG
jgi:O-antigen/teichoic acid export membrane protein